MVSASFGRSLPSAPPRPRAGVARVAVAALGLLAGGLVGAALPRPAADLTRVVVRSLPGAAGAAAHAVAVAGGRVVSFLPAIDEVVASVPAASVANLRGATGVVEVTEDAGLHLLAASYDPTSDVGSAYNTAQISGAADFWKAGYTGRGVDVAVIDSGVVPVDGLTAPGKVVLGPDFTPESQHPATASLDTYGHGTHVAGLIAGRDDAAVAPYSDPSHFTGMAPDARIVSVKVADAHGSTTVATVIAAIDWVVQHRNDRGLRIRVLNLAFGTDSAQTWRYDPLAYAAEAAWRHGIVVVVSAGNNGTSSTSLTDPAYDPDLLAVGAADTQASLDVADHAVASFSSTGLIRHPDLVAPGVHMVSLRDPGSYIDQTWGSTGLVGNRFFRGSGSSQAAAVVSGAAALLLSQRPWLTADDVKALLVDTAQPLRDAPVSRQGSGELDLHAALTASVVGDKDRDVPAARGRAQGSGWTGSTWSGSTWSGSTWSGSTWSGSTWSGQTWSGSTWSARTWSGSTWSGSTWSGSTWSGSTWSGSTWSGSTWSGSTWSGSTWSGSTWSDAGWLTGTWD